MKTKLTIRLSRKMRKSVDRVAKGMGLSVSEFIRRAVQQELWDEAFESSRRALATAGSAKGISADEDVFRIIS